MAELKYSDLVAEFFHQIRPLNHLRSARLLNPLVHNLARGFSRLESVSRMPAIVNHLARHNTEILGSNEMLAAALTEGVETVQKLADANVGMHASMEAIFEFVIRESWTLFEIFASDLWVVAIDSGPKELVTNVVHSKSLNKADSITPEAILGLEFDPRRNMGSFLRETRRVTFQKISDIRTFYSLAFGVKQIDAIFDDIDDGYVYALSAVRNALTHNGGRVDGKFLDQAKRFSELRSLPLKTKILLDGEVVAKHRNAAANILVALFKLVDDTLTPPQTN